MVFSKPFFVNCGADVVIGKERAVVALGGFVQFDAVVVRAAVFSCSGDALFYVARGLADFEQSDMCRV